MKAATPDAAEQCGAKAVVLGGVLQHVLDAIRMVYERGFRLELVTLVVRPSGRGDPRRREAAAGVDDAHRRGGGQNVNAMEELQLEMAKTR